jgi:hypothetical protein
MMEHMLRPLVGKERSQWRTQKSNDFDLFVPFCHRSLLGRLVSHPKASRKVQRIFLYDQRSHCGYALHRVRVFLLSFLHFSAMRFASLYRRERPLGLSLLKGGVIKQAQARERIVPRANYYTILFINNCEIISERRTNDDPILKE